MKAIVNANIIMPDHVIPNGVILLENGVIKDFGKAKNVEIPTNAEIIAFIRSSFTHSLSKSHMLDAPPANLSNGIRQQELSAAVIPSVIDEEYGVTPCATWLPDLRPSGVAPIFSATRGE